MSGSVRQTGNPARPAPVLDERRIDGREFVLIFVIAVALSFLFWGPLWEGGSLIGGDLFPYFFPQKVFLAEQLQQGTIPLWNPLTGHGYPTIAESQTGVCYPPDLLAYSVLPVTAAYNAIQLLHYLWAFVGVWLLARRLGASAGGGVLAGVSFVYGWFPARICLEWAIITGSFVPWILWCAESYLQHPRRRYLLGLSILLAGQLLAGHFHLAFLTLLTLVVYAPVRDRLSRQAEASTPSATDVRHPSSRGLGWLGVLAAIHLAFLFAAVQLLPTWELKQRSQRSVVSEEHQPGYGHLPPRYWTQMFGPWMWYTGPIDESLRQLPSYAGGPGTNQAEAHLYFGVIPLGLAVLGTILAWRRRGESASVIRLWSIIGLAFLLYTPGWFLPITQHLPGFNFFRGPGRYGLITSLSVAVLAGITFSGLLQRLRTPGRWGVTLLVIGVTTGELWYVAQLVGYSQMLPQPIVENRHFSPLRDRLLQEPQPVRLFAPMPNVANLLEASATPVYLGIGPAEYFDPQYTLPTSAAGGLDPAGDPRQIAWLEAAGVTHILSLQPLTSKRWPVERILTDADPVLSPAFKRSRQEPFQLYRLTTSTGRLAWRNAQDDAAQARITRYTAHRIEISCDSTAGGQLVLRDLAYPGWRVQIDGVAATPESVGMFRAVTVPPGAHQVVWTYRPASVYWGLGISLVSLTLALVGSVLLRSRRSLSARSVSPVAVIPPAPQPKA